MKKMFIFVAIVGLAFASCKKEEQIALESSKNAINRTNDVWVRTSKNIVEFEGAKYNEFTNSASGQKAFCEVPGDHSKAPKYDRKAEWVNAPGETWKILICEEVGDNCYNRGVVIGGSVLVQPYLKDEIK